MFLFLILIASSLPTPRDQTSPEFPYTTLRIQHWILSLKGYPEMPIVLMQSTTFGFQNHTRGGQQQIFWVDTNTK